MARRFPLVALVGVGLVVVGGLVAFFWLPSVLDSDSDAELGLDRTDQPTFVMPTGQAVMIDPARIAVEASSHLPPADGITYDPANTIDGDPLTAWNSDSPEADGRGESLTFRFSEPVDLKKVRFVNGYAKNPEIYAANHRLREVLVLTDRSERMLTLLDTSDPQEIGFDFGLTSKVRLEVVDVYTGDGFARPDLSADLALSEVSFVAVQR